jgi:hypothetical protein
MCTTNDSFEFTKTVNPCSIVNSVSMQWNLPSLESFLLLFLCRAIDEHCCLMYWLKIIHFVLRPAQIFFTCMKTSPFPVKDWKIYAYARHSGPLSREGSLLCHTCCDTGRQYFRSHPKDRPIQSPLTTHMGMWRIYFNTYPHGFARCSLKVKHMACGGRLIKPG